jgi:hypothetical protein
LEETGRRGGVEEGEGLDKEEYQKVYDDLVEEAKERGFKVVDVPYEQLRDYAAMHPIMARKIGYPMPDDEIHMNTRWNEDIEERTKNLKHELDENKDMAKGEEYWDAHLEATDGERELEKEIKQLQPRPIRRVSRRVRKPRNFERMMREEWGDEELEMPTRRRRSSNDREVDSSGLKDRYYFGHKLPGYI